MDKKVKNELKLFIPIFVVIILFSIGINGVMPEKIPAIINISGTASDWVDKNSIHYHIPIPELIIYVFLTFLQFNYVKTNVTLSNFIYHSKLVLIIFCGVMIPLTTYLYSVKFVSNIWYFIAPAGSALIVYIFICALIMRVLNKKKKVVIQTSLPKTRKKKKTKKK